MSSRSRSRSCGRRSASSRSSAARCARSASARSARRTTLPDRPEIRGMIARVPHLVQGGGAPVKIHDLKPAPGSTQAEAPGRARHRRQGRQDRGPRQQGPGRARHRAGPVRGWPDAAAPPHAEGEGLQQPVPRRVPRRQPVDARRRSTPAPRSRPTRCGRSGLVAKRGLVKVLARGELTKPLTVRAHGFSAAAVRAIEAAGGTDRGAAAARGRPVVRRPEGTRSPTASYTRLVRSSTEVVDPMRSR